MTDHTYQHLIGRKVNVSTGTPKPPKGHKRKVADWENDNYSGTITEAAPLENGRVSISVHVKDIYSGDTLIATFTSCYNVRQVDDKQLLGDLIFDLV